jgi:hypothetical protein
MRLECSGGYFVDVRVIVVLLLALVVALVTLIAFFCCIASTSETNSALPILRSPILIY